MYKAFDVLLPETEMEEGQAAAQKKNVVKFLTIMSYLAIIIQEASLVVHLEKTKTKSWPSGKAWRPLVILALAAH